MSGILTTVFAALLSHKLGWDIRPGKNLLLMAGLAFALAILLPAFAPTDPEAVFRGGGHAVIVVASVAKAAGALLLVLGVLSFSRER
jgi:hypothetical protein